MFRPRMRRVSHHRCGGTKRQRRMARTALSPLSQTVQAYRGIHHSQARVVNIFNRESHGVIERKAVVPAGNQFVRNLADEAGTVALGHFNPEALTIHTILILRKRGRYYNKATGANLLQLLARESHE